MTEKDGGVRILRTCKITLKERMKIEEKEEAEEISDTKMSVERNTKPGKRGQENQEAINIRFLRVKNRRRKRGHGREGVMLTSKNSGSRKKKQ